MARSHDQVLRHRVDGGRRAHALGALFHVEHAGAGRENAPGRKAEAPKPEGGAPTRWALFHVEHVGLEPGEATGRPPDATTPEGGGAVHPGGRCSTWNMRGPCTARVRVGVGSEPRNGRWLHTQEGPRAVTHRHASGQRWALHRVVVPRGTRGGHARGNLRPEWARSGEEAPSPWRHRVPRGTRGRTRARHGAVGRTASDPGRGEALFHVDPPGREAERTG